MQFEKLNENKIRITLSHKDLEEKNIDFHSFMANPIQSQDLFFDMLDEAEKQIGFVTKDYQIRIEALAMSSGDFILTITRVIPDASTKTPVRKKVKIKRKSTAINSLHTVYKFNCYDDFYYFMKFIKNQNINIKIISKNITLYEYKNTYYLVFDEIDTDSPLTRKIYSLITEFGTYVNNSELFIRKLNESGKIIIKNNSILNYMNYIPEN